MNYYPTTNEFPQEIFDNLLPIQHRLVFHDWMYKMLGHCFDQAYDLPDSTCPYTRHERKLTLAKIKQGDSTVYKLFITLDGFFPVDVCQMPGASDSVDRGDAWEDSYTFESTFDVDVYAEEGKTYIAPSTNTDMFLEQNTFESIAEYFWMRASSSLTWIEEIQIAPAETYLTPFMHTDDVDTLMKFAYDMRIKPFREPGHVVDAFRTAEGEWHIKTPWEKLVENGYDVGKYTMEMILSYALSRKKLLTMKDKYRLLLATTVYRIEGANGNIRTMDLCHHVKIDLANDEMRRMVL